MANPLKDIAETVQGSKLENKDINNFISDAVRCLGSSNIIRNNIMIDSLPHDKKFAHLKTKAHRDFIQLIANSTEPNAQYFGATAQNNIIEDNSLASKFMCQGVFSADGGQHGLIIKDNTINTKSPHGITISGMFSGEISNNYDKDNNPIIATLDNFRFGGGLKTAFYAVSFKDDAYEAIACTDDINDHRGEAWINGKHYQENFDLKLFRIISNIVTYTSIENHFNTCVKIYNEIKSGQYSPVYSEFSQRMLNVFRAKIDERNYNA